ncbi:MAG: DUF3459 domain-containing protein [Spartobacteria bacterium]|nr:DUF3459 domain-containing protein [Spartobacteria bacterium]
MHAGSAEKSWVPDWAADVVWYQIFPDRFRNGDTANDPDAASIQGAWPHDGHSPWQVHPWTSDWYRPQPWEQANGRDIWYNIQRRRYGGDLQGVLDALPYLQDLGVNGLYLNPVFMAPSAHKYDGATYHHVDPFFGPDPQADIALMGDEQPADPSTWCWTAADRLLLRLVADCHQRGMRIILDGVFNHMGLNSWAFKDVIENQQRSLYKDWFKIKAWDDPDAGTVFAYQGWNGVRELPELQQDENGLVQGPRDYVFAITRRWMDPHGDGRLIDGIDGWRLDVAECVRHPFWKAWRAHVKAINPSAYITAEIIFPVEKLVPYLRGDEFDAVMNYNFAFACDEFLVADKRRISALTFDDRLRALRQIVDPCAVYVQQNLVDSHDTARLASHIVNRDILSYRDWNDYFPRSHAGRDFSPVKPNEIDRQIQKLVVLFQMTYIGAPMVYYGDEAGMWGCNDPCCRKPMVWDDLVYEDERCLPDGSLRAQADSVAVDHELWACYKKLIHIRNTHAALRRGDFESIYVDEDQAVYGFRRRYGEEVMLVLINVEARPVTIAAPTPGRWRDVLNDDERLDTAEGTSVTLLPRWGRILLSVSCTPPESPGHNLLAEVPNMCNDAPP